MSIVGVSRSEARRAISDHEIAALAARHGTPLYVYDLPRLRGRISDLRCALAPANATLFFATMANDQPPILRQMAKLGLGACVNSLPHLALATKCGFAHAKVQFTSTGMTSDDMRFLQERGIKCNLDSLSQLRCWLQLGVAEAGIRINASSIGCGLPHDRIGIDARQLNEADAIASHFGSKLSGLHIYLGTNFQHPREMLPTLEAFFELAATSRDIGYVNLGGGIGVNYRDDDSEFDILRFGKELAIYAARLREGVGHSVEVIVEPGRALVADCGTFVTSVTDVKELGGKRVAAVDGSVAIFPRPFHHPDSPHRIRQIRTRAQRDAEVASETLIVGRTTFSRDILGSMWSVHPVRTGDLLALAHAGAYSQSMASRFLGQREPEVVFSDN